MEPAASKPKLLVIVGVTASGKSDLAMKAARKFNGEIICADSRTVYKGLDIGTAKPTAADQKAVAHWGLDLVAPDQDYNVAQFKTYTERKIEEIIARNKLPILAGGSGLYIDAVLFDYDFSPSGAPRDSQNPRHLKHGSRPKNEGLRPGTMIIGLEVSKDALKDRITARVEKMVAAGLVDEARRVAGEYSWDCRPLNSPGYKAIREYLEGRVGLDEAKSLFIKNDLDLAKRQKTWFQRNRYINWFNNPKTAYEFIEKSL